MTYCLGMKLNGGLVAIADTRITAGSDVYTNKKISVHEVNGASMFIMTAGLRSIRDKSITYFKHLINDEGATFDHMHQAASTFGEMIKKVASEDKRALKDEGYDFNLHTIIGGQMPKDTEHKLYLIFPESNWIEINEELMFQIIGNSNFGKPIIHRTLSYDLSLKQALKIGLLSFDATRVSANDVSFPIDVIVYEKNSFKMKVHRLTAQELDDPLKEWSVLVKNAIGKVNEDWMKNMF
ncbi:MAG: peptidase [Pseudarcicella sp.]|nr:peptidase [Pseudarcicella sp.]MBP6409665.1 peptidase [Pseudarcicella sp.]